MLNVAEIDVVNYKFNKDEPYTRENLNEFIVKLVNHNDLLDKRINKLFSMNRWLYTHFTKEDIKQEVMFKLLEGSLHKLPYIVGIDRMRYLNKIVSNVISKILSTTYRDFDITVDNNFICSNIINLDNEEYNVIKEIFELFITEKLEEELLTLAFEGYNNLEIMEIMNLGRYQFEKIRENIREKLVKEGYYYLENKEELNNE